MDWPPWHETRVFRPEPLLCPPRLLPSPSAYYLEGKAEIPRMFASQARALRRIARVYPKTEMASRLTEGTSQQTPFQGRGSQEERLAERCYQMCYHLLE
jgi:hypothetical protein